MSQASAQLIEAVEDWTGDPPLVGAQRRVAIKTLVAALNDDKSLENVWLTLAVLTQALPSEFEVRSSHRVLVSQGAAELVARLADSAAAAIRRGGRVELVRDSTLVDVRHTAETDLATGIQRVARETVKRWAAIHDVVLVTWTRDGTAMRRVLPTERDTVINSAPPTHGSTKKADKYIVVPVGGRYILPELAAESWRTQRLSAMAEYGAVHSSVIGFDCVPLTTAETVGDGMPGAFARNLSAVAKMAKVGTISDAAAVEYRGWRRMLSASGIDGPEIVSVELAEESGTESAADEREFAELIGMTDVPLILVVGSHEPRKNHLAVLQAAELAWRDGLEFQVIFVGGNSWNSLDFFDVLQRLKNANRPVDSVVALPDRLLWAAYRLSRFTIFVSINEGFGLPVAESLASGTPVLTSHYGSMQEIASEGGALTVDPRKDASILSGIRRLLTDNELYARLKREASEYVVRPWDDYARELWDYFADDQQRELR